MILRPGVFICVEDLKHSSNLMSCFLVSSLLGESVVRLWKLHIMATSIRSYLCLSVEKPSFENVHLYEDSDNVGFFCNAPRGFNLL